MESFAGLVALAAFMGMTLLLVSECDKNIKHPCIKYEKSICSNYYIDPGTGRSIAWDAECDVCVERK